MAGGGHTRPKRTFRSPSSPANDSHHHPGRRGTANTTLASYLRVTASALLGACRTASTGIMTTSHVPTDGEQVHNDRRRHTVLSHRSVDSLLLTRVASFASGDDRRYRCRRSRKDHPGQTPHRLVACHGTTGHLPHGRWRATDTRQRGPIPRPQRLRGAPRSGARPSHRDLDSACQPDAVATCDRPRRRPLQPVPVRQNQDVGPRFGTVGETHSGQAPSPRPDDLSEHPARGRGHPYQAARHRRGAGSRTRTIGRRLPLTPRGGRLPIPGRGSHARRGQRRYSETGPVGPSRVVCRQGIIDAWAESSYSSHWRTLHR